MNEKANISNNILLDDDAPELGVDFFQAADLYHGATLIRKGRPKAAQTKQSTTLRLDADIIAAFKADGQGWQTRINQALREWLDARHHA